MTYPREMRSSKARYSDTPTCLLLHGYPNQFVFLRRRRADFVQYGVVYTEKEQYVIGACSSSRRRDCELYTLPYVLIMGE